MLKKEKITIIKSDKIDITKVAICNNKNKVEDIMLFIYTSTKCE